jgi:cytochrome c553
MPILSSAAEYVTLSIRQRPLGIRSLLFILVCCGARIAAAQQPQSEADQRQFFEQKIRPVLVQHCYTCHSADALKNKKLQAGLLLDSAAGTLAGGESGPAIVKGKSNESLLVKALRHDGFEMPPSGKLPDEVIKDFERWIDSGAFDPRDAPLPLQPKREINLEEGRKFWSFQPLREVQPPEPASSWAETTIDRFIAARHRELGLTPSKPAAREKLARRLYYDLIGLPPTLEQVDKFINDSSPQAYERLVDSLLESPHYGERWGRHWLDVARFAESGGYEFDGFRPGAYHYRDWVIRALNADMPYDEFLRMQLAGDKLEPGYVGASAAGFLVAGPYPGQITAKTVERIRYDQLDDMLMTIGGSMLGLTLGCVRCHEHKYDPLPQPDYYALAATLARTSHGSVSLDPDPAATAKKLDDHRHELTARNQALDTFAQTELPARFQRWRTTELPQLTEEPRWQVLNPLEVGSEDTHLNTRDGGLVIVDGPRRKDSDKYIVKVRTTQKKLTALRLDALTDKSLPRKGPGLGGDGSFALGDFKVTARPLDPASKEAAVTLKLKAVQAAFAEEKQPLSFAVDDNPGTAWRANQDVGRDNAALFEIEGGLPGFAGGAELTFELKFAGPGLGRFRLAATTEPGTVTWAGEVAPQNLGELRAIAAEYPQKIPDSLLTAAARWFAPYDVDAERLRTALDSHQQATPRPPLVEVYSTVTGGQDVFLLRRGEVDNKAGKVEPGYLQVLTRGASPTPAATTPESPTPATASAAPSDPRIALGQWLTDVEHGAGPLVARVAVNRLWLHHFGEGIVGTPNDFGFQGERPTHPELLEWLAGELVRGGWRLKPLHKTIVMSATYRQGNDFNEENARRDPDNRQLWQFRPRRLAAEQIRDGLLSVGGTLDATMYGPSILDNTPRRSVYLRVKRSELIPFMTMFDAPEPTQSIGERISTTVPTQALALLNSPFVRSQSDRLAARLQPIADRSLAEAIDTAYRIAYARRPTTTESGLMLQFVSDQQKSLGGEGPAQRAQALQDFCHALLCLNEFVYVD